MNGLRDFLAPFSHLLFANRNIVIVLLCAVVFWVAIQALLDRWRADRLERELTKARTSRSPGGSSRRHASSNEESAESGGALPPVKGGRTYARNLGSALQKAGMSQPIYSPPTPAGWVPNTSGQSAPAQPGMAAPYAAPPVPWATQPPASAPWAFPGGGRGLPGASPTPAPFYSPQPNAAQPSPALGQPQAPGPSTPGSSPFPAGASPVPFTPPVPGPFGHPPFGAPGANQPPAAPFGPPSQGPLMMPPAIPAVPEAASADGGRRGKPKRRRFNFNVLENLEKMVQSKPAEPTPATGWTPPPASAPTTAQPSFPPSGPLPPAAPVPGSPTAEPNSKSESQPATIPLPFGQRSFGTSRPEPEQTAIEAAEGDATATQPEPEAAATETSPSEEVGPPAKADVTAPEPAPWRAREPKPDARRSMRSMMFGEEAPAESPKPVDTPTAESAEPSEPVVASSEPSWSSPAWGGSDETSASVESEPTPSPSPQLDESATEAPIGADSGDSSFTYDAWKSSQTAESESEVAAEPAGGSTVEPAEADSATPEISGDDAKPGAGTVVIIEDDSAAASYYSTLFKGNGYRVEVANDGVSGVDLCTRVQPQVILLDVMMPRQNGILVLQTLRASDETKNTPVVVMSNFSEPTLIKRALQLGALEYVIKTQVEGPALLNALPRWMNREKAFAAA